MEMSSSMGDMPMGTPTIGGMAMGTATSMLPAATAAMSGSMDMGMGSSKCKISVSYHNLLESLRRSLGTLADITLSLTDVVELEHHRCVLVSIPSWSMTST